MLILSSSRNASPKWRNSSGTKRLSYSALIRGSALPNTMSNIEKREWKNGQFCNISSINGRLPSSIAVCTAFIAPNQDGSTKRVCAQAKIHGIARKLSIPPLGLRLAGRLPKGSLPSSCSGVATLKYGTKVGS